MRVGMNGGLEKQMTKIERVTLNFKFLQKITKLDVSDQNCFHNRIQQSCLQFQVLSVKKYVLEVGGFSHMKNYSILESQFFFLSHIWQITHFNSFSFHCFYQRNKNNSNLKKKNLFQFPFIPLQEKVTFSFLSFQTSKYKKDRYLFPFHSIQSYPLYSIQFLYKLSNKILFF